MDSKMATPKLNGSVGEDTVINNVVNTKQSRADVKKKTYEFLKAYGNAASTFFPTKQGERNYNW